MHPHGQIYSLYATQLLKVDELAELIGLPEDETVAAVIPYGYEIKHPKAAPRLSVEEVLRYLLA